MQIVFVTLRGLLKRRGFSLCASYADMRGEPHTRGRCHSSDYVGDAKFPTILVADVDRADSIAVPGESALFVRAVKHAPAHLAPPVPALGARATRVAFLLQDDLHPQALRLVGELEAHAAS